MSEENFLLVSLKENEAKKLAQVISNDTSRKILDMLASKDATESEIAKKMKLPLSTVHYNMQALLKAKLVQVDEFHYSEKGKEVNHYSLANKYVIIAPKDAPETLKDKLRKILPVGLIGLAGAGMLQLFSILKPKGELLAQKAAPLAGNDQAAEEVLRSTADEAAPTAAQYAEPVIETVAQEPNLALWFLFGTIFTIIVFLVVDWIQRRK